MTVSILWFRQDLRLADQPALVAAAGEGAVIPVFILDDETPGDRRMGGASRWWLHHSLAALGAALEARGQRLILRRGRAADELARLSAELGTRRVTPSAIMSPGGKRRRPRPPGGWTSSSMTAISWCRPVACSALPAGATGSSPPGGAR